MAEIEVFVEQAKVKLLDDCATAWGTIQVREGSTVLNLGGARIGDRTFLEKVIEAYREGDEYDIAELDSSLAKYGYLKAEDG